MSGVAALLKDGGKMVSQVDSLVEMYKESEKRNETLYRVIEEQGATLTVLTEELTTLKKMTEEVHDVVKANLTTTDEIKRTKFVGKSVKILDEALEKVEGMSNNSIRSLIHRAAKSHPSGKRKGYTRIYEKLFEVTGFNVYEIGPIRLKKSDGVEGWKKDPSYINTIFKEGYAKEAAVICLQMLADN